MKKAPSTFSLTWTAHEHEHKERSSDWFWAMGIIAVSVAVAAIIFGNVIFGILVIVASFSLSLFINREPREIRIEVTERGITRDNIHYPYSGLESFWIDIEHSHPKILLRSSKFFLPLIIVPLGEEADLEEVHEKLMRFLKEEPHALPFVERLLEYLGF